MMKRILSLLTALTLLLGCAGAVAEAAPVEGTHQIEKTNVPVLVPGYGEIPGGMTMYFADGVKDLPYIDLRDWADFMGGVFAGPQKFAGLQVTFEVMDEASKVVSLTRENGHMMTTAWGTSYQLSSPFQLSFVKNGSYYDVDQGAEPDVFIRDFRNFYDRNALTELINNLH